MYIPAHEDAWLFIAMGLFFLGLLAYGLKTGVMPMGSSDVPRADRPAIYAISVALMLLFGGICLTLGLVAQFTPA